MCRNCTRFLYMCFAQLYRQVRDCKDCVTQRTELFRPTYWGNDAFVCGCVFAWVGSLKLRVSSPADVEAHKEQRSPVCGRRGIESISAWCRSVTKRVYVCIMLQKLCSLFGFRHLKLLWDMVHTLDMWQCRSSIRVQITILLSQGCA